MAEEKTILLTQEAYDKMKEELACREGEYVTRCCQGLRGACRRRFE